MSTRRGEKKKNSEVSYLRDGGTWPDSAGFRRKCQAAVQAWRPWLMRFSPAEPVRVRHASFGHCGSPPPALSKKPPSRSRASHSCSFIGNISSSCFVKGIRRFHLNAIRNEFMKNSLMNNGSILENI